MAILMEWNNSTSFVHGRSVELRADGSSRTWTAKSSNRMIGYNTLNCPWLEGTTVHLMPIVKVQGSFWSPCRMSEHEHTQKVGRTPADGHCDRPVPSFAACEREMSRAQNLVEFTRALTAASHSHGGLGVPGASRGITNLDRESLLRVIGMVDCGNSAMRSRELTTNHFKGDCLSSLSSNTLGDQGEDNFNACQMAAWWLRTKWIDRRKVAWEHPPPLSRGSHMIKYRRLCNMTSVPRHQGNGSGPGKTPYLFSTSSRYAHTHLN